MLYVKLRMRRKLMSYSLEINLRIYMCYYGFWCTCFITKTEVLFFLICALKIVKTDDKKHERRKCCCEGREKFYIFHTLCKKNKKQKKRQKWVQLFLPKKKRDKKETEFFSKQKLHSFLFIFFSSLLVLFCGVSLPRSEDHRESFCEFCFLKTQREKEREKCIYFFF